MVIGTCVADRSIAYTYHMWYSVISPPFPEIINLCHDTDAWIVLVKCSVHKFFTKIKPHFDFSNFPPSSPYCDTSSKFSLGRLKSECSSFEILRYFAVRCKQHSYMYLTENDQEVRKCAGIPFRNILKDLRMAHYENALLYNMPLETHCSYVRPEKDGVYTLTKTKTILQAIDFKQWITNSVIHSYPLGYWRTLFNPENL